MKFKLFNMLVLWLNFIKVVCFKNHFYEIKKKHQIFNFTFVLLLSLIIFRDKNIFFIILLFILKIYCNKK